MKKFYFIAVMAMFCVQGIWAQAEEMDSVPTPHESGKEAVKSQVKKIKEADVEALQAQLAEMQTVFQDIKESYEKDNFDPDKPIYKPLRGKSKWYRYQALILAPTGGASKDRSDNSAPSGINSEAAEIFDDADEQTDKSSSFGINYGWEMTNVWGKPTEEGLKLNRFGFAWSFGFLGDFKAQGSEPLFSFMGKLGVEAGNSHRMGIGIDFLGGLGKGFGYEFDLDNLFDDPDSYSVWCPKYGFQIWIRTGIVKSPMKNVDMNIFVRYVYSVNPQDEYDPEMNLYRFWHEEDWSFGMTFKFKI